MPKEKHTLRNLLVSVCGTLGGIHLLNRFIIKDSVKVHRLAQEHGSFYCWKYGRIFYKKEGNGKTPILLIHDASEFSCGWEWRNLAKQLKDDFTIYTIDLPGCGRSDKPAVTYTNYFYVMAIRSFMKDVIGEPTWIAAAGLSSSFAVMAGAFEQDQILGLYMINPCSLHTLGKTPDKVSSSMRMLLSMPIIGTGLYHLITSRSNLEYLLGEKYFYNPFKVDLYTLQIFHESAHLHKSAGRYFTASLNGRYMNWDIRRALTNAHYPVRIFYGEKLNNASKIAHSYRKFCSHAIVRSIVGTKMLPHLECPEYTASLMRKFHS